MRNGPGADYDVIAHLEEGARVPVMGLDTAQDWILIEYEEGLTGWAAGSFLDLVGDTAAAPIVEPTPLPEFVRIEGITYLRQSFNNCAPTALTMALTHYGGPSDQNIARNILRPSFNDDVSVDIAEMSQYVNDSFPGVRSVWRMGGNWTVIRQLVASGFPVIIETSVQVTGTAPGWAGHNRVIIGYDGDTILTYDSYLGNGGGSGLRIEESVLDELWRHMNRNFMVLYPAERESEVSYIMGEMWSVPSSVERAHRIALAEMAADPNNAFAQYNLGTTLVALGRYEDAALAYDEAFNIGLPFRIHWYQFGVFEAYYNIGRYNEVLDITRRTLNNMGGMAAEELYYWLALGYAGRGQLDQAVAQMERAIRFNPNFTAAQDMLDVLTSGTYEAPIPPA